MKTAKLGVIFLVSMMALAAAGAGYALWSEDLNVNMEINTGVFKIGVRNDGTGDEGPHYLQPGGLLFPVDSPNDGTADMNTQPGDNSEGKNVASTISTNPTQIYFVKDSKNYFHSTTETVYNAYPWYTSWVMFTFANGGTIPAKINDWTTTIISDPDGLLDFIVFDSIDVYEDGVYAGQYTGALEYFQYQLEPCHTVGFKIWFHFEEEDGTGNIMPQSAIVSFTENIQWAQWNEVSGIPWTP